MPKKTREEAKEIINNIEANLAALTGPDFKGEFSSDPAEKRIQQILLYYRLGTTIAKNTKGKEREKYINTRFESIKNGSDSLAGYIFSLSGDERQESMLEELAMEEYASIEFVVKDSLKNQKENEDFFDKVSAGLFAPETDRTQLGYFYEGHHVEKLETAQNEIDSIKLSVPEDFAATPEVVNQAVLGTFLSDDIQERNYALSINIALEKGGSSLYDTVDFASSGMSMFFENMTKPSEDRENMQSGRYFIAEARRRTAAAFEAYSNGDKKPLADALMNGFNKCLNMSRYTSDIYSLPYRNASRNAIAIYKTLNRSEFKDVVEFTPEQKRWASVLENELNLVNEADRLKSYISQTVKENYGKPGKPANDLNTWLSVKRLMEINIYADARSNYCNDIRDAYRHSGVEFKELDNRLYNRDVSGIEALALDNPQAYGEYISKKVLASAEFANFGKLESWRDMYDSQRSKMTPSLENNGRPISMIDNLSVAGRFKRALSILPEKRYEELREMLAKASCLDENKKLPENPTREQCRERLNEYKKLDAFMRENGYYKVRVDVPDKNDPDDVQPVFIGSELEATIKLPLKVLEAAVKKDPIRDDLDKNVKIEDFIKSLKENYDKNGKQHELFDKDGNEIGFTEAYEALKNGDSFRLNTFNQSSFLGIGQTLKFDPKQKQVVITGEKFASRSVSIAESVKEIPAQIKKLKQVQELLRASNPFFVSNSTAFNEAMESLDTLIDAQQRLDGENANIRQVGTLLDLYGDLEKKVNTYVAKKGKALKPGDDRGKLRHDVMKSLSSIIKKEYVTEMADFHYKERSAMKQQSETVEPTIKLMQKWNTAAAAAKDPEKFCKAFDKVLTFAKEQEKSVFDRKYVKMGMAADFSKLLEERMHLAKTGKAPELASFDLDFAESFKASCDKAAADYVQMDPRITISMQPAAPKAEIGDPSGHKDPEIEAIKHPDLTVPGV